MAGSDRVSIISNRGNPQKQVLFPKNFRCAAVLVPQADYVLVVIRATHTRCHLTDARAVLWNPQARQMLWCVNARSQAKRDRPVTFETSKTCSGGQTSDQKLLRNPKKALKKTLQKFAVNLKNSLLNRPKSPTRKNSLLTYSLLSPDWLSTLMFVATH